jgi:hypothetical protein
MPAVTQPIQNTYFYKEVRKTQPGAGVIYSGYPIYHLYKNVPGGTPIRLDEVEYWMPLPGLTKYKEYTAGDENVIATRVKYEPRLESLVKKVPRHYTDRYAVYTHKYYGTKLFVATGRTKLYPLSPSTNPYSYRNIQIWVESKETYTDTYDSYGTLIVPSYWYHPFKNEFYPFGNLQTFGITDTQYLIDTIFSRDTSGQSNESLMANTVESIRISQVYELISQGKSREEAVALINAQAQRTLAVRESESLITPKASTARQIAKSKTIAVTLNTVKKNGISATSVAASQTPKLVQTTTSGQTPLVYEFVHRPNQITYSSLGSDWTPIDRAANRPMVDWKSYKLMSVSFSFIVASDISGNLDDALDNKVITTSVDEQLKNLRQMASSPFPVVFMGFDKLLSEPVRYPFNNDSASKGSLFVIADLNVSSIYRSSTGAISRASCDITLTEYPQELIKLIEFPKLKPIPEVPPPPPGDKGLCDNSAAKNTWSRENYTSNDIAWLRSLAKGIVNYDASCKSVIVLDQAAYDLASRRRTQPIGMLGVRDIFGP